MDLTAAYDSQAFREQGARVLERLARHLDTSLAEEAPVLASMTPEEALARVPAGFPERPHQIAETFDGLLEDLLSASNHLHHPGYVGHQVAAPLPLAALAEAVSALLNNGMAIFEMGQLQTAMEHRVLQFLAGRLGFGPEAGGVLTHGGSLGNLTALLAARQRHAGHDVWTEGQREPLGVLVSEQAHYCVARAAQVMGWGAAGALGVPVDARFRMRPEALREVHRRAADEGRRILAVVASSCTTATGSFDPIDEVAAYCEEHGLWLHVDGAHGASVALSPKHRGLLRGIERADSVVWDLHKLMALPALNTAVLFRDGRRSYEAFAQEASYLFDDDAREDAWHQIGLRTLECTKRGMGVTAYTLLRSLGTDVFVANIETQLARARALAQRIEEAADFELAVAPQANIVCFRHVPAEPQAPDDLDALQLRLRRAVVSSGRFYLVTTGIHGATWLRTTMMNPLTTDAHLDRLLQDLRDAAVR